MKLLAILAACGMTALCSSTARAGPPYITDDPEPVEYRHWELYLASLVDHDASGWTGTSPHVEVNYGAVPDVQLHVIAPLTFAVPVGEAFRAGLGDTELGVKWRFVHEGEVVPQVGVFPFLEVLWKFRRGSPIVVSETAPRRYFCRSGYRRVSGAGPRMGVVVCG
jgi:hypothetical protein